MKKLVMIVPVLAACALLAACGGEGGVGANADPAALQSEKVAEEKWTEAFAAQENYCMRATVTSSHTENEATMSEVTTVDYCNDGDRAHVLICVKEGDKKVFEAESYADLTDEKAIWGRVKEGDAWSEWDYETYTSEQFAEFFGGFRIPAFARDRYAEFSYNESEKGYTMTEDGLAQSGEAVDGYLSTLLEQTPADVGGLKTEKFVLKFKGGRPSACLFEGISSEETKDLREEPHREQIPSVPLPLPRVHFTRHGRFPRILIEIRPIPRATEPLLPEAPSAPATKISCSQLFYNYGKARVTFPSDLPPATEE